MRILLSNDDGIDTPGLALLEAAARQLSDDVWVVAPETKHTAASHRLSCGTSFELMSQGEQRFACTGSPADCIVAAMTHVFADIQKPDLVFSGINAGRNVAEDIAYSGTLAIAREATFWGIPAIGLSRPKSARATDRDAGEISGILRALVALIPQWQGEGYFLGVNLPEILGESSVTLAPAVPGSDKIAYRSEASQTKDGRTRLTVNRGRRHSSNAGDQNAALEAGKMCIMRYDAFSQAPLPAAFNTAVTAELG